MKNNLRSRKCLVHMCLALGLATCVASCSSYATPDDTKKIAEGSNDVKYDNTRTEKDAQFLVNVAEINLEEIKLGQLAQLYSNAQEVKDLGKMMEEGHGKKQVELIALAKMKAITIPTVATQTAQSAYDELGMKSGMEFDQAYCDMMVKGHKNAIEMFEVVAKESKDKEINAWATETLHDLRIHLDHAVTCQAVCEAMRARK